MRRGRGEGSIFFHARKRRWCATLTVGYSATGRRRRRSIYARTKGELLARLQALRSQVVAGTLPEPRRITLAAFLDAWLEGANLRPATKALYRGAITAHITPHIGGVAVSRLAPMEIQRLLAALKECGVGAAMRQVVYRVLRRSLRQAVRQRLLAHDPCEGVEPPRYAAPPISPFSIEELRRFFAAARADRLGALYILLGTTGLRVGEALGLTWKSIDLSRGVATITQQLLEVSGRVTMADLKTSGSRREVPLAALAVAALKEHRKAQLVAGHYRGEDGLVFTDGDGGPLRRSNLRRRSYHPLLQAAGLPRRPLHVLRHSVATALLGEGVPVHVVSALLGHVRPSITLNVYAGYAAVMGQDAAARLNRLFDGQPMDSQVGVHPRTMADAGGISVEGGNASRTPLVDASAQ